MKQDFNVEIDDGTQLVIASDARDIRAWEAAYGASWFGQRLTFTMLAQVAYLAGQRTGVLNGSYPSYEDFDARCVDVRGRPAEVIADPTQADRTDGSSVPSRSAATRSRPPSKRKGHT